MKTKMNILTLVTALVGLLAFSAGALAAQGPGAGNGGGGGGGDAEIPDYGDLIKLYRDVDGVPIPSPLLVEEFEDPETGEMVDGGLCWQPLAFNVEDELACPTDCVVDSVPLGEAVVDVNQFSCGVAEGCSGCTQEVEFERINSARSPASVYESQLADVIVNLATADCVTLDPAGRMVASRVKTVDEVDVVTSGAIDSPLQNLAIYRQLMLTGELGVPLPQSAGVLSTAARGLGAGSGKGGEVNVDLVAYLNSVMGLTDPLTPTYLDKICETYREEVQGVIQLVEKCFLNYGIIPPFGLSYQYSRGLNFGALPAPKYIPEEGPYEGWFEYLRLSSYEPSPLFEIMQGPILDAVFGGTDPPTISSIGGFAQAADDTRATINFMHDWPMPDADIYATPVVCVPSDAIAYDVLISEESGLQVPKQMVDGSEGREFFVTVANASGSADPASGTVTVTAIAESGGIIVGSPWVFEFTDLAVGASKPFTQFFTVNLGERTKINWTAVAETEFDVNPPNNIVTAVTNVKTSGN
jgi:hypothetical protein